MTDEQLDKAANRLERLIASEQDWKSLPELNRQFQAIIDEQVKRDLAKDYHNV